MMRPAWCMQCDACSDGAVPDMAAHLGPAVVLKDMQGQLSYWALLHAPGKPDFHHPDLMRIPVRR